MPSVFRNLSALKLVELNDRFHIFHRTNASTVLDLAAAPGGFTQVALEGMSLLRSSRPQKLPPPMVIAVDQRRIQPLPGAVCIQSNILNLENLQKVVSAALLIRERGEPSASARVVNVILHDGVSVSRDQHSFSVRYAQNQMVLQMLKFSCQLFAQQCKQTTHCGKHELLLSSSIGSTSERGERSSLRLPPVPVAFVTKLFDSAHKPSVLKAFSTFFSSVEEHRPVVTPSDSAETYLAAFGFRSLRWEQYVKGQKRKSFISSQGSQSCGAQKNCGLSQDVFSVPPLSEDLSFGKQFVWRCAGCQTLRCGISPCPLCTSS